MEVQELQQQIRRARGKLAISVSELIDNKPQQVGFLLRFVFEQTVDKIQSF